MVTLTGVGLGGCRVPLPLLAHGSRLLPSWGKGSKWGKATVGLESPVTPLYNLVSHLLAFSSVAPYILAFLLH